MKFIDEQGKINGKVSIVDIFVILLLIACVAAVGIKLQKAQSIRGGDCMIEYSLRIENIRDLSVNAINQNYKDIEDAETGYALGEIVNVETSPARVLVQTNDGMFKMEEYDNRYDVVVTLQTSGTETDDGFYASSGRQICVGETIGALNGYVQLFGEVVSVKTLK